MSNNDAMARQLEWQAAEVQHDMRNRQFSDPLSVGAAQLRNLSRGVEILFGRVMDGIPYVGTYKVLPERGMAAIPCSHLPSGPNSAVGVRANTSIPPGAHVWFIYHRSINYGLIIGVEPYFGTNPTLAMSDYIYIGSRSGLHRDTAHSFPWTTATRGIGDWSSGNPFDSTTAGEWCMMSKTGMRVFVDDYMAAIGTGEACGLTAFLFDNLCRLSGINLQIRSQPFEWEALDDESELYEVLGRAIYPWEALGAPRQGGTVSKKFEAQATEIEQPWYGAIEPAEDNQMPVRRRVEYGGYLGQGGKRIVQVPSAGEIWTYGGSPGVTSVFEENVALTGAYSMRSAKSITISKRPLIPKLYPQRRPEDSRGDSHTNYKASSAYGDGPEHKITGNIKLSGDAGSLEPPLIRHAGSPDLVSYIFNWECEHPFWYHGKDWRIGEENESQLGSEVPPPMFGPLIGHGKMYMPDPPTAQLDIDHRYKSVDYALTNSYLTFLEDGGIALADGFGSEIRMTGGSIHVTAPGDIWNKGGRNVVSWGGRDVMMRAKRHVDISATEKDVRIKAERHCWLLAGNGKDSGMLLLESRSYIEDFKFQDGNGDAAVGEDVIAGGVVIRAPHSNAVTWAKDVYLRTGGGTVEHGTIVLDAGKGKDPIVTNSSCVVNFFMPDNDSGLYLGFYDRNDSADDSGGEDITVKHAHGFASYFILLDCYTAIRGDLAVDGHYFGNNWIYADNGHIATSLAPEFSGLVPGLKPGAFKKYFAELKADAEKFCADLTAFYMTALTNYYYVEFKAGNDDVMKIAEFSFCTSKQYGTLTGGNLHFRLYEDRWQQLDRLSDNVGTPWSENWVITQGIQTATYPGAEAMVHPESYVEMGLTIFQPASGTAKTRGSDGQLAGCYADPQYGTPDLKPLDGTYRIIT
jgi:hypothetical protein